MGYKNMNKNDLIKFIIELASIIIACLIEFDLGPDWKSVLIGILIGISSNNILVIFDNIFHSKKYTNFKFREDAKQWKK